MSEEEKKLTAYHEAGHALVALNCPEHVPIHKATIIPRGQALGMVQYLPEKDQHSQKVKELKAILCSALSGRMAEEIIFGKENITYGAASDIQKVTQIATSMVTEWGMSEKLGRLRYSSNQQEVFLGHSVTESKNISDDTAAIIDKEIRNLINEAEERSRKILTENIKDLHTLAKGLLEYETLTEAELKDLIKGIQPSRDDDFDDNTTVTPTPKTSVPKSGGTTAPQPN